ncbi:MAG TPA: cytochrome c3 family protein, partial [Pirellulales bacterium]|nr:cytochrome c3 family protein [Pirellulales bacterium]
QIGIATGTLALLTAAFVLAGMAASGWLRKAEQAQPANPEPMPGLPRMNAAPGFAASAQCRECHPQEHASWHDSYHRQMTQVAHADTVLGPFDGVDVPDGDRTHRLSRRGDELWVETVAVGEASQASGPRRVLMTTGAHHMQLYWTANGAGNLLDELPLVYIREDRPEKSRWAPLEASYLSPSPPGAEQPHWNKDCILCHATGGRPGLDARSGSAATRLAEVGIACEACHGPAERHVRLKREQAASGVGDGSSRGDDHAIVNPAKLHPERGAQVCGHCHSAATFVTDQLIEDFFVSGSPYRPGDDLLQTRLAILPARLSAEQNEANRRYNPFYDGTYWPDGMIRATGREYNGLVESTCYQKGGMTCLSCHSMHQSDPDDQLAQGKDGNQACYQCHASYRDDLTAHTHHRADSSGSQCYNCHMPHTTYGLFKAIRSHQISSPNTATTVKTGRPAACNVCHLDQTLEWTATHLRQWYGQPTATLEDDQRSLSVAAIALLQGDSFKRALFSWIAGWQPALDSTEATAVRPDAEAEGDEVGARASGTQWLVPLLAPLLEDESPVIRLVAWRSLRAIDEGYDVGYDFVAPQPRRAEAARRVIERWRQIPASRRALGSRVLLDADGEPQRDRTDRLLKDRDNTMLRVNE